MPVSNGDQERLSFAVLGPVRVRRGPAEVAVGTRHQRLLLALLLVRAGRLVEVSEMVDFLWGGDVPPTAVNMVHRYVGVLRRALEPALPPRATGRWLLRDVGGYRLVLHDSDVDLLEFRTRTAAARQLAGAGDDPAALASFLAGLRLWRGRCGAGLGAAVDTHPEFVAIEREYVTAVREAAATALRCDAATRMLPVLREAAARHPLDEALQAELLLGLSADGNQGEAIAAYGEIRKRLVEELAVEPGPELQAAYRAVLRRGDDASAGAATREPGPSPAAASPAQVPPAQLPSDLRVFTGRTDLLREGVALVRSDGSSVPILAFDGMPGVGKTTSAVHLAHLVAPRFPDGQLYADLRGFDPDNRMAQPADVLQAFLGALGVGQDAIPASLDARAALFRSVVAGRRLLIVLDNARDADQVRPLLPGTAGHAVLITSRGRLAGLAAGHGAHLRNLDVLSTAEARACFEQRVGAARVALEPAALEQIIERCGRLPLALAIVAARAAADADRSLAAIAGELAQGAGGLDAFSDEELDRDLRAVFTWSYRLLSAGAARTLRLLPLHPGPDVTVEAAAALAGVSPAQARAHITELVRTRLLDRYRPSRFRLHDLVRAYATELCSVEEPPAEQDEARRRLANLYLCTTYASAQLVRPGYDPIGPPAVRAGVTPVRLADTAAASIWFIDEYPAVRAIIEATQHRDPDLCWRLALFAKEMFNYTGLFGDWAVTAGIAVEAAERAGDTVGMAYSEHSLAGARHFLDDFAGGALHLERAAALFEESGNVIGRAQVLMNLGYVAQLRGNHRAAIGLHREALAVFGRAGRRDLRLSALTMVADDYLAVGDLSGSRHAAREAVRLARELDDIRNEDRALSTLARIHCRQGRHVAAIRMLVSHMGRCVGQGMAMNAAKSMIDLGDVLYASGEVDDARQVWGRVVDGLDHPDASVVTVAARRRLEVS